MVRKKKEEVAAPTQVVMDRPVRVEGATYKILTPLGKAFITINQDEKGDPFEIFIMIGKAGSEVAAMAEALGTGYFHYFKIWQSSACKRESPGNYGPTFGNWWRADR